MEPGEPFAVNIATDEIAFFPILYWPVLPNARPLPEAVLAKIDAYMKQGGMIIFDTKDYGQGMPTGYNMRGDGTTPLQRMLGKLICRGWSRCPSITCSPSRSTCCARSRAVGKAASCGWKPRCRATAIRAGRRAASTG